MLTSLLFMLYYNYMCCDGPEVLQIRVDGRLGHREEIRHGPLATNETFNPPQKSADLCHLFPFCGIDVGSRPELSVGSLVSKLNTGRAAAEQILLVLVGPHKGPLQGILRFKSKHVQ